MKPFFALFSISLVFAACSKSGDRKDFSPSFKGKWIYSQYYQSSGGLPDFFNAPSGQSVNFKEDGSISTTMDIFKPKVRYELIDSVKVRLFTATNTSELYGYRVDTLKQRMIMYSLDYICIEGCGVVLKR